jgi:hypothetical protein
MNSIAVITKTLGLALMAPDLYLPRRSSLMYAGRTHVAMD